jgi:hypothetical protein
MLGFVTEWVNFTDISYEATIVGDAVPAEISKQLAQALEVIERHLASMLLAVHLYGSALDGGLRPQSDIDLLVTVSARPAENGAAGAVARSAEGLGAARTKCNPPRPGSHPGRIQ